MSENSSDKKHEKRKRPKYLQLLVVPLLVIGLFFVSQVVIALLALVFKPVLAGVEPVVLDTAYAALVYVLTIFGLYLIHKKKLSLETIGLQKLPTWLDIGLALAGFITYFILTAVVLSLVSSFLPSVDLNQSQDVGFDTVTGGYTMLLAFVTLVVVAPVAEEVLFRGYMYGKLKQARIPVWLAILVVSTIFGLIHGQWNVFFDTFTLSIVLCVLREITGNIWASILLHMIKNGIAFYILFINTSLLGTIGG